MDYKSNISNIATIGVAAAVICILGPLSVPTGIVPISLTNLAIYFSLYALGTKKGVLSYIIYMLIGLTGIPVFSYFTGGIPRLFGPTGGYIIGFIFMALISGIFIDKFPDKRILCVIGMILGTAICYTFGTIWLAYQANMSAKAAFTAGVLYFIPGDLIKIFSAAFIGPRLRRRLKDAIKN